MYHLGCKITKKGVQNCKENGIFAAITRLHTALKAATELLPDCGNNLLHPGYEDGQRAFGKVPDPHSMQSKPKTLPMNKIKVQDRYFTISIPEERIQERVKAVAAQINTELEGEHPLFLSVLNGSFMFAADLLRNITMPCEISFVRMASYEGTCSTGEVKQLIGLKENIAGRTVVIVEDIIDSGLTMKNLIEMLSSHHPKQIRIASLLVKPGNLKVDLDIPYCCFEIPNDFIVGYGLDYDGEGRNLRDIYTVTD